MDKKRLKMALFGEDYFEACWKLGKYASERRFYQKITDIYATSVDYNKDAPTTGFSPRYKTSFIMPFTGILL